MRYLAITGTAGRPGACPSRWATTATARISCAAWTEPSSARHRRPNTSLHVSRDEGQTWGENVEVDTVGGAYPSMVNLKDGSVLIVYYEEGPGSSIRARKFKVTGAGVEWINW